MNIYNWDNPASSQRIQLVFENRNQNYGAYTIRKSYDRTVLNALLCSIILSVLLAISPKVYQYIFPKYLIKELDTHVIVFEPKIVEEKKIETIKEIKTSEPKKNLYSPKNTLSIPVVIDSLVADIPKKPILLYGKPGLINNKDSTEETVELPNNTNSNTKPEIRPYSQDMPAYPGGEEAMMDFISKNLHYPEVAKESKISGIVYIAFVVDDKGNLQRIQSKRGIGGGCEEEAIRVLNKMPKWSPGKDNGRPVNVEFILPIKFTLH